MTSSSGVYRVGYKPAVVLTSRQLKISVDRSPRFPTAKTVLMKSPARCMIPDYSPAMPASSLEERVHELCAQAIAAKSQAELEIILPQLQAAIRDHIRYVRIIAAEAIPEAFGRDSNA